RTPRSDPLPSPGFFRDRPDESSSLPPARPCRVPHRGRQPSLRVIRRWRSRPSRAGPRMSARKLAPERRQPEPRQEEALTLAVRSPRLIIDRLRPCVDDGRFAAKAVVGQALVLEADVFADG